MIRSILLASVVMISAPVLAQEVPTQESPPAAQEQTPPPTAEEPAAPAQAPAPAEQPAETAQQPQEATPPAQPAAPAEQPAQAAQQPAPQGQQPANATQIATVVDQGFPAYDKDADGSLKAEEFNSWMVALRSASEPAFKGESAADKEWLGRALAQADADKSGGVNKDELKTFLTPAPAAS